jgi:hypothetical protein
LSNQLCLLFIDISFLKVKYDKEVRLLLGCAVVETKEGLVEGRVGPNALSYSGQTVLSISDYRKRQNTAIAAPKSLKGTGGQWVINNRPHGSVYEMDPVDSLDLVGKLTKKKLAKLGLVAVKDISNLSREKIE